MASPWRAVIGFLIWRLTDAQRIQNGDRRQLKGRVQLTFEREDGEIECTRELFSGVGLSLAGRVLSVITELSGMNKALQEGRRSLFFVPKSTGIFAPLGSFSLSLAHLIFLVSYTTHDAWNCSTRLLALLQHSSA